MQPLRVYVRAPNWVGDMVMATAAFARIRAGFPQAHVTLGMRPYLRTLIDGADWFDAVHLAPARVRPAAVMAEARALRRQRFDLAILLPNSVQTALVAMLAGIPVRAGYRQGRPGLINLGPRAARGRRWWQRRGPRRIPQPMPEYYDLLLDEIGLPPGSRTTRLVTTDAERDAFDEWLRTHGIGPDDPVIAFNAGASYGGSKMWLPDRFAAVARHFQERGMRAVFLSGPNEVEMVRSIARDAGAIAATDPVLPLGMLKPMIARSRLLVTTDTGPRHVAVALGVPVVCLIGPTDSRYTDYGLERTRLLRVDIDCAPCQRKVCPLGHHRCMTEITTHDVIEAVEDLLAGEVSAGSVSGEGHAAEADHL